MMPGPDRLLPCSICGTLTEWRCADCAIGRQLHHSHPSIPDRATVAICESPTCRDAHERMCALPARPPEASPSPPRSETEDEESSA